jgi:hypothetical protein
MNGRRVRVDCRARAEEGDAGIALTKHADTFQLAECHREIISAAVLGDNEAAWCKKRSGGEERKDAAVFVNGGIRRIEENDVERSACGSVLRSETLQTPQRVELENACASADA